MAKPKNPHKSGTPDTSSNTGAMIRVNQAGEYGAVQIYKGQLAILGKSEEAPLLRHMLDQEKEHLRAFDEMIVKHRVRPTVLSPLWHLAGFALGAGTALMGKKAAMACTVAIEEVIDEHYAEQEKKIKNSSKNADLYKLVKKCRAEENEHKETGLTHGAEQAVGYPVLRKAIRSGSKLAIWLSKRV
jgi:ubiquinone biosynthesis monooxygenase Coq7